MSGAPTATTVFLSLAATIAYSADPSHPDTLPANTLALLPDGTSVSFDRTADVYIPYVIKGDATLRIIKESLLPTLTSDYAPLARVELHGIKPYQPEPYLASGGAGNSTPTTVTVGSDTTARAKALWNGSTNDAQPSGWHDTIFDDSAWAASLPAASGSYTNATPLAGSTLISPYGTGTAPQGADVLFRQHVSLPAGTITAATFTFRADDLQEGAWLNGTAMGSELTPTTGGSPGSLGPDLVVGVNPATLVAGGDNVVALWVRNVSDFGGASAMWADFTLVVTYAGAGQIVAVAGPAEGDLAYYHNGTWQRLPIGTTGQELTVVAGDPAWATPAASGVSSVAFAGPTGTSVSGSPITSSGTITLSWASQTANTFLGAPSGSSGAPTFRALVGADIPVDASTIVSSAGTIKGNYQAGSGVTISGNTISATGSGGTVTSVALSLPGIFSVSGSPITGSGTLAVTLATESANTVLAGPASGSAAAPTFRALAATDLPAAPGAGGNVHAHGHFL